MMQSSQDPTSTKKCVRQIIDKQVADNICLENYVNNRYGQQSGSPLTLLESEGHTQQTISEPWRVEVQQR